MFFLCLVAVFCLALIANAPGWLVFWLGVFIVFGIIWRVLLAGGIIAAFLAGWRK